MPGTLTHWRIAIEALSRHTGAAPHRIPSKVLRVPVCDAADPGHGIPVLAFVGAIGPDLPYTAGLTGRSILFPTTAQRASRGHSEWADRMHYNRSGLFLIELLRTGSQVSSAQLRQKILYYALGHATHIAGDSIVHPFTNAWAGAYHHQSNPQVLNDLGIHFYVEFCHDLATDIHYFRAPRHTLLRRPWLRYVAGAHSELVDQHGGVSLLEVLIETARSVYDLDEAMAADFGAKFLAGLRGARTLLHVLSYYPLANPLVHVSPQLATYFTEQEVAPVDGYAEALTFDQMVTFAAEVGGHLCSLITSYFADLTAGLPADGESYTRLRQDLRDWNLDTGYTLDQQYSSGADGQALPAITLRHSWHHFSSFRSGQ